jgi:FkbM family methyltransferase
MKALIKAIVPKPLWNRLLILRMRYTLDSCRHRRVQHGAGAEHSGTLTFNRGSNGHVDDGSGDWGTMEVKAVSIDDLAAENRVPDVRFVDVEGFECEVLRGARQMLAHGPDCFVEAHVGVGLEKFGGSVERLLSLFPAGYQFFVAPPEGAFVSLEEGAAALTVPRSTRNNREDE